MTMSSTERAKPQKTPPPHFSNFHEIARDRAQIFGTIAAVFNQLPDARLVDAIRSTGGSFWQGLKKYSGMNAEMQQGLLELSNFAEQFNEQSNREVEQSLKVDWTRLFRGLSPGLGPMPPYETLFLAQDENEAERIQSIAHIYREHGLEYGNEFGNRPDYLGIECDFLRYLSEKEAEAWLEGDQEQAIGYNQTTSQFFSEHLGKWAQDFCGRAARAAQTGFYRGFLHLIQGIVKDACKQYAQA
jgi:TorA maturation chaperone TorD